MCVCVLFLHMYAHPTHIYIYIYTSTCMYIYLYIHIHVHTIINTRTYISFMYVNYIYMYKNDMHICLASSSWPCYSFPRLRSKDSQTPLGCCLPLDPSVACAQKCGTYFFDLRRVCSAQSFVFCFAALGLLKTPCKAWRSL